MSTHFIERVQRIAAPLQRQHICASNCSVVHVSSKACILEAVSLQFVALGQSGFGLISSFHELVLPTRSTFA